MTDPSACWLFSSIATSQRVVARVPLRVATGLVPFSPRERMSRRRAWNVVQLLVLLSSSQRSWDGSQASQSYLRAALEPRSPAATSMTR